MKPTLPPCGSMIVSPNVPASCNTATAFRVLVDADPVHRRPASGDRADRAGSRQIRQPQPLSHARLPRTAELRDATMLPRSNAGAKSSSGLSGRRGCRRPPKRHALACAAGVRRSACGKLTAADALENPLHLVLSRTETVPRTWIGNDSRGLTTTLQAMYCCCWHLARTGCARQRRTV